MKRLGQLCLLIPVLLLFACTDTKQTSSSQDTQDSIEYGTWRFTLSLGNKELPFNAAIEKNGSSVSFHVINSDERIELSNCRIENDTLKASFPAFDSDIELFIESPQLLTGNWLNKSKGDDYIIPLIGESSKSFRFTPSKSSKAIPLRYHVVFSPDADDAWDAVLELENKEGILSGTFLTETGDYRYLDGNIMNQKIYLSTFDGSHAFYFEADITGDSLTNGMFLSGNHYERPWVGSASDSFELTQPEKLTYLNEGYQYFDFKLPNQDGDTMTWKDLDTGDKVVIIDIMGSWCPNCLDANIALKELVDKYDDSDVELVTIAFERSNDLDEAKERVFKMQESIGLSQEFLFGGRADKKSASRAFPMLNHIMSFPTLIFIDKDRDIRQIYTGFYGPGTGEYYDDFMVNTEKLLDSLVSENI